ncbi:hypothetical protein WA026_010106 [Henosepilachna vigintioctopunctata]|uniref:Protein SMG5 n=1 Tax=Henosepilachna vigintioctopunctata TaxID=420089 RepID=A0AAW1UJD1_9CUCU
MKKRFNSVDINQKHGNELSKKLYKTITDLSKRLDDARCCTRNILDLFSPNSLIQRRKLGEYCERLIFSDPVLFGRKAEELLWRKVFYDVVSTAKKLKKANYSDDEVSNLMNHIYSGIGFYHHMILKLQTSFKLNLQTVIDFATQTIEKDTNGESNKDASFEWAEQSLHQCLMYLGDLSRYKLEISGCLDAATPTRYYMQAIAYKPEYGMPYNQMGTLAMNQNCHLEAVYHYMRCLSCKYSFEGTINNLNSLFEKNSKYIEQLPQEKEDSKCSALLSKSDHIKRFIARFLLLIDIWYFNKNVPKVYNLCHLTFKDLDECLSYIKSSSENGDIPTDSFETNFINSPSYLSSETLFRISVICLLSIAKLQSNNSPQVSTIAAFTLAVYSQLIQNVTAHIEESVLNYPLAELDLNSVKKSKCRNKIKLRRRKLNKNVCEDSETSDDDLSLSSSDQSFISDQEDLLADSTDDEIEGGDIINGNAVGDKTHISKAWEQPNKNTDKNEVVNNKEEVFKKVKKMDVNDMIEIISEETLLQSIKILNDWLMIDTSVFKSCCINTPSLLRQITYLLNLLNINLDDKRHFPEIHNSSTIDNYAKFPLPEDVIMRGLDFLSDSHKNLDWQCFSTKTLSLKNEAVIRIFKFKAFGRYLLSITEAGITFDDKENIYVCKSGDKELKKEVGELISQDSPVTTEGQIINGKVKEEISSIPNNSKGGQLIKMKHMGQLWLASEVSALENRVKGRSSLSPYLVLDADALIKYNFMVKHLVHTRKFIVLVPNAVVSVLDDLKREKPEARDAIRWLEAQFHKGNRFFRSQRPQERALIPFIKYPKKRDKEMFTYIQIIECCYYLSEQQKGATNLVTLLIGNQNLLTNGENKEFSYVGLAQTAGITIESITQFYAKTKKATKDNR